MNLRVKQKVGNLLTSWSIVNLELVIPVNIKFDPSKENKTDRLNSFQAQGDFEKEMI
jgi:hypothetical protein